MLKHRMLRPTIYLARREASEVRHAVAVWLATGMVPVAHIVAEPEPDREAVADEPIAA